MLFFLNSKSEVWEKKINQTEKMSQDSNFKLSCDLVAISILTISLMATNLSRN